MRTIRRIVNYFEFLAWIAFFEMEPSKGLLHFLAWVQIVLSVVLFGPLVAVAYIATAWWEAEEFNPHACSAFGSIGFIVLWAPWLIFLFTIAGEAGWLP